MSNVEKPFILAIDDNKEICDLVEKYLSGEDYRIKTLQDVKGIIEVAKSLKPDLILLDVIMPSMSGYEICIKLKCLPETKNIPIVFMTVLDEEQDKAKAFALGATGYIAKPFKKEDLLKEVGKFLNIQKKWEKYQEIKEEKGSEAEKHPKAQHSFLEFKKYISSKFKLDEHKTKELKILTHDEIYSFLTIIGLSENEAAKLISEYLGVSYYAFIDPEEIALGKLPTLFSKKNFIIAVSDNSGKLKFILSNPFDTDIMNSLSYFAGTDKVEISIASKETINTFFRMNMDLDTGFEKAISYEDTKIFKNKDIAEELAKDTILGNVNSKDSEKSSVKYITNQILYTAINEGASDIRIEPVKNKIKVRFNVKGELKDFFDLKWETGIMVISRLKAVSDMNINEFKKPQEGTIEILIAKKTYKFKVSTKSVPEGESMVIQIRTAPAGGQGEPPTSETVQ
ncbi:MAG: ATPase, T2SS/T4P/T4SS family [Elusimicrobia bacterium]|nr:ATPase, T2SS/T4P/T4SS family [Elusimicrobiota bacterium]